MRQRTLAGFAIYCLIAGSLWKLQSAFASSWPPLLWLAVHDLVVCLVFTVIGIVGNIPWPKGWETIAVWGAILFAGPAVLIAGAGGSVTTATATLLLALIPFLTAFLLGLDDEEAVRFRLPALAGLGGLALVVPFTWPPAIIGDTWFIILVACSCAVAFGGIRLHRALPEMPLVWAAAIASGAAALLCGAGWAGFEPAAISWTLKEGAIEFLWGLVIAAPLTFGTFWLLRELDPVQLSSRFLLVPFVTIARGMVMLPVSPGWTTWLGLALICGSVWMLLARAPEQAPRDPSSAN